MSGLPSVRIDAVLAGPVALLPDGRTPSAMVKRPVDGPVEVGPEGLLVDRQADRSVHGGPEKALLHYPFDHYASWRGELPDLASDAFTMAGAFGENLTSVGITEADVCIGDRVRIGSVLLEVSQGRQPCFKLNVRHGRTDLSYRVQKTGRTGWYYRVIEPGRLHARDIATTELRPNPDWPLSRAQALLWVRTGDRDGLRALADLPQLAESWRKTVLQRLESGVVEDWSRRLAGPPRDA